MLIKQGDATDGGTPAASEGSCGSAAQEGRVPLGAGYRRDLMHRMEGSHSVRRGPATLLHREGEPSPPLSTKNFPKVSLIEQRYVLSVFWNQKRVTGWLESSTKRGSSADLD